MVTKPPNRNLSDQATPWGRWVEDNIQGLQNSDDQQAQSLKNSLKSINGTLSALTNIPVTLVSAYTQSTLPGGTYTTPEIAVPAWAKKMSMTYNISWSSPEPGPSSAVWAVDYVIEYYSTLVGSWAYATTDRIMITSLGSAYYYVPATATLVCQLPGPYPWSDIDITTVSRLRGTMINSSVVSGTSGGSGLPGTVAHQLNATFSK